MQNYSALNPYVVYDCHEYTLISIAKRVIKRIQGNLIKVFYQLLNKEEYSFNCESFLAVFKKNIKTNT